MRETVPPRRARRIDGCLDPHEAPQDCLIVVGLAPIWPAVMARYMEFGEGKWGAPSTSDKPLFHP